MRKIILFILPFFFFFDFAFAQNQRAIDSLISLTKTTTSDSLRIQAYREISWEYESVDNVKGLEYVKKAYSLARKINNKEALAGCLTDMGILNDYFGQADSSLFYYKKAVEKYKEIGDEDGICVVYINMGSTYRSLGKFSEALKYLLEAIHIADKLGNKDRSAACMITIGNIYRQKKNFDAALKYNDDAYKIFTEVNDFQGQAIALNNNGIIFSDLKNSKKALECYHKALKIRESLGLKLDVASSYSSIACEYLEMGDLVKSIDYNKRSIKINEENIKPWDPFCKGISELVASEDMEVEGTNSSFQINAVSELPTVEQMLQSLQQVEVIPYVDESSTIVSLNQIEKLNPEAAAIVTKEIASSYTDDGTDYNDEDEQTKSMRMSLQPVEGAVSQGAALVPVEPNYKKITLGVGCLFLAWVLFGRKN